MGGQKLLRERDEVVGNSTLWTDYVRYDPNGQAHIRLEHCSDAPFALYLPSQYTGQIKWQLVHRAGIKRENLSRKNNRK